MQSLLPRLLQSVFFDSRAPALCFNKSLFVQRSKIHLARFLFTVGSSAQSVSTEKPLASSVVQDDMATLPYCELQKCFVFTKGDIAISPKL